MTESEKKYGRTFFDFISEHRKTSLVAFLVLLSLLTVIIIFNGNSVKVSGIEISSPEKEIKTDTIFKIDTVLKIVRETIVVEKPKIITKYIEPPKPKRSTIVKKNDTEIEVENQPVNINTGSNSGTIGNNNIINNFGDKPVELIESDKRDLIRFVNLALRKLPEDKVRRISIRGMLGNSRSIQLAQLIYDFLKKEGYNVGKSISHAVCIKPKKGVKIFLETDCLNVDVFIV